MTFLLVLYRLYSVQGSPFNYAGTFNYCESNIKNNNKKKVMCSLVVRNQCGGSQGAANLMTDTCAADLKTLNMRDSFLFK